MKKTKVAILGSTGSIGKSALAALALHPDRFEVTALTAHANIPLLMEQARQFSPKYIAASGGTFTEEIKGIRMGTGPEAILEACDGADVVLLSIMGMAGLPAFEYCIKNGIKVALATKEAMVCGGRLVRDLIDRTGTEVLPVDSELSAIFQSMAGHTKDDVKRVLLTASGGPFRKSSLAEIRNATKVQALKHPNWSMGAKITIDSATMMNKGLEIMETRWFFDVAPDKIQVVVHPESVIHSMVEYYDNSVLAHLAYPDMRLPILYALSYPDRLYSGTPQADFFKIGTLHFEEPDLERFPCLQLAYEAVKNDGALQLVLNSANEVAVDLFLKDRFGIMGIYDMVADAMQKFSDIKVNSFDDIYRLDREIRGYCLSRDRMI
ncbi:MAG: 1-deoxy-D-xylulose-5-phosphate reductoisomerase [Christensenellaceae bacterium]|nr:1-deoxy-D-xylulose-5-phosphate reductoisomerase [Christensenellaceae bacterium]